MILKKITTPSAKWDSEANTWWVGHVDEFSWTDMKDYEISPRMKLGDALKWIIEYDMEKSKSSPEPQKIKN
ncbi:hypothetical protein EBU71_07970 [bacterium]|jgi:hypothetical protein|nr:hypothetical protein [Candidatus Elulimicrobium humile]